MSSFSKDVAKVASAPIVTQVLSVLLTPIITRLYSPEAFGVYQLFGSISAPLLVFTTMGYTSAILISETEEGRINLLFLSISIALVFSAAVGIIFFAGYDIINAWLKIDQVKIVVWVLPLSLLLYGINLSMRYWNLRKGRFQQIAVSEIFRNIGNYFIVLPAGLLGYATSNSLIIGGLFSVVSTAIVLSIGHLKFLSREGMSLIQFGKIKDQIKRYRKFPIYNTPTDLLSRFSSELPVFLFGIFYSQSVIGFYSLSLRILRLPVYYLGNAVGEVYYQRGALDRKGDSKLLIKLLRITFVLGLPFFCTISIIGSDLFVFLFGQNWKEAGLYSQILSLYIFIKLFTSLASYLTNILEKQEYNLIYNSLDIGLISIGVVLGGLLHNVYISLFLILILSGTNSLIFGYYLYMKAGISIRDLWNLVRKPVLIIIPFTLLTFLFTKIFSAHMLLLLSSTIFLLMLVYLLLIAFDDEMNQFTRNFLFFVKNKTLRLSKTDEM